ncbi:MAG: hypothetical protein RR198_04440 [Oscillospiraceae bacterium]
MYKIQKIMLIALLLIATIISTINHFAVKVAIVLIYIFILGFYIYVNKKNNQEDKSLYYMILAVAVALWASINNQSSLMGAVLLNTLVGVKILKVKDIAIDENKTFAAKDENKIFAAKIDFAQLYKVSIVISVITIGIILFLAMGMFVFPNYNDTYILAAVFIELILQVFWAIKFKQYSPQAFKAMIPMVVISFVYFIGLIGFKVWTGTNIVDIGLGLSGDEYSYVTRIDSFVSLIFLCPMLHVLNIKRTFK